MKSNNNNANMKNLNEMNQAEVLHHINHDLKDTTHSFKESVYINWEINADCNHAGRVAAFKALAAQEARHALACEVVGEWAKKNGKTGKAGRMSRKCRIDRLTRDCSTREQMEAAL